MTYQCLCLLPRLQQQNSSLCWLSQVQVLYVLVEECAIVRFPQIPATAQILVLIHLLFELLTHLLIHLLIDLLINLSIDHLINPLIPLSFEISASLCLHYEMSQNGEWIQNTISPHTKPNSPDKTCVLFGANNNGQYILSSLDDKNFTRRFAPPRNLVKKYYNMSTLITKIRHWI